MRALENITYDELSVGDFATFTKTLTEEELILYAAASGDVNPVTVDSEDAQKSTYKEHIGHGMWAASLISTALSTVIPGPGTVYLEQNLKFDLPVILGDTLVVKLTIIEKMERGRVKIDCSVTNQDDALVVSGEAKVVAPTEKISLEQSGLPRINIEP